MASQTLQPGGRLPGLERLRVAATLCVVALHAGIAYAPHPLPGLAWATHDVPTAWADAVCWVCNAFVMPVFFILGGFAAAGLLERLGPADAARHRLRRLGGPLLLGCVLILPLDLYSWLLGYAADGVIELRKLKSLKLGDAGEGLWGVSHLWFLQYLLLMCLGLSVAKAMNWRLSPRWRDHFESPVGLATLALITSVPLAVDPQILVGFRHSWWPLALNFAFYAPMFAYGVLLADRTPREVVPMRSSPDPRAVIAGGLLALGCAWPLMLGHFDAQLPAAERWAMSYLYTAAGWMIAAGAFEVARRDERPLSPRVTELAAASFWIYLLHHPVVGCAQVAVKPLALAPEAKMAIVFAYGLGVPLLTFDLCVRRTFIGRVLGVKRAVVPREQARAMAA